MRRRNIAVIDYGMGNLRSVENALHAIGVDSVIESNPLKLGGYDGIILPGVGAFQTAIQTLNSSGMVEALEAQRRMGKTILGICLGMQLMCQVSSEDGVHQGLGWIEAEVKPFNSGKLKVPHMGWNNLTVVQEHPLLTELIDSPDLYFLHSYHVACSLTADVIATCLYGETFCAAFARDNVLGVQFHPEKSQQSGLRILSNFVAAL